MHRDYPHLFDISRARLAHLEWEMELEDLLRRKKTQVHIDSYENCDLGLWLYSIGLSRFGGIAEIHQLEEEHRQFHAKANSVLHHFRGHRHDLADHDLAEVRRLSKEIIFLLTKTELKLITRQDPMQVLKQPLLSLRRLFSG